MANSRLSGLHRVSRNERLNRVAREAGLSDDVTQNLAKFAQAQGDLADHLAENVIGVLAVPLGVATNLTVDGEDVLVPMATEESSVVAAVCNGARACREAGGVTTEADPPCMIAQIQITDLDPSDGRTILLKHEAEIREICNSCDPMLVKLGGGLVEIAPRILGNMLVLHLIVDVRDAMGANTVNTMAEALSPHVARWTGGKIGLRILSNLADRRLVRARATWPASGIGAETVDGILAAYVFAATDPYRAATHNKGIMNGIDAVALATGNDTRAIEAGAHAYAAMRDGGQGYHPLTRYWKNDAGDLVGEIELPMAVGIVGGATRAHPTAQSSLKIMGITNADRLARVIASVGLIQNFSALRALATEGIQRGHMSLHARNVAITAGAVGDEIDRVADEMVARKTVREDVAIELLREV
ncbi:hydroxymethylglutaryl-CoA reductase, degradative [Aliiroseovarius lamellibrachiae]|uniref:hydroxymethylglutaryl-CoA reductase, degradative n=1 Tax=Aliiroseovarius lamellibrachiae TaxID=1924933 RepID=UPI001BDF9C18|nr:hydroxymethylglutaryl-CoA reductase, degradative [Aliiroseovarius lamellibrachiae]MBT2129958.1 hydroxymethylglutaryl-CoA reductase, degradative [Aliiroseovarius lamellibrachiae]